MNEENSDKLVKQFPDLFCNLPFGCECGNGWFSIIWMLCFDIMKECKTRDIPVGISEDTEIVNLYISQIKEKFGGLRFYTSVTYDFMDELLDKAEELSEKTCEECGREGSLRNGPWLKVRCDECFNLPDSSKSTHVL